MTDAKSKLHRHMPVSPDNGQRHAYPPPQRRQPIRGHPHPRPSTVLTLACLQSCHTRPVCHLMRSVGRQPAAFTTGISGCGEKHGVFPRKSGPVCCIWLCVKLVSLSGRQAGTRWKRACASQPCLAPGRGSKPRGRWCSGSALVLVSAWLGQNEGVTGMAGTESLILCCLA